MIRYQWSFGSEWVDCKPENNKEFAKRRRQPSLEPLYLTNDYGEIWGSFEDDTMKFRLHGEETEVNIHIRRAPKANEHPLYAVITPDNGIFLLDYDSSGKLFHNGKPKRKETEVQYATETFKSHNGKLYQRVKGEFEERRFKRTDLSRGQFEDMTRTRYTWQFKGPFLDDKVQMAVERLCNQLGQDDANELKRLYESFVPNEEDTEYGPYQFRDYLTARNRSDLAFQLVDTMATIPDSSWKAFDALTNCRIEKARSEKRPMALFYANDKKYMIVFDAGNGESGQSAVIIHPTRYQKIMESIEEQFNDASQQEHHLRRLDQALQEADINPYVFSFAMTHGHNNGLDLIQNDQDRERITSILSDMQNSRSGNLSTRIQQFMPALLEKYKECEVQLSTDENIEAKPVAPDLVGAIDNGLAVSEARQRQSTTFKDLIHFTQRHQCWVLPKGKHTCDICGEESKTTLTHCGTASACMKCWADSLVHTNMACPFCRKTIDNGDLKKTNTPAPKVSAASKNTVNKRKRKRFAFDTPEQILSEIHKDEKYNGISISSKEPMRKWFTILLRRKMIKISQMPKNEQGKKDFLEAMRAFKLLA